jgi:hypothetical protein
VREGGIVDALGDAVVGSQAMKDPTEETLDGGTSTLRQRRRFLRFARKALAAARKREWRERVR